MTARLLFAASLLSLSSAHARPVRVAVYDIAASTADIETNSGVKLSPTSINMAAPFADAPGCAARITKVERALESMVTGQSPPVDPKEKPEDLGPTLYRAHPLHIWQLVGRDVKEGSFAHFGGHDPDPEQEKKVDAYITSVRAELKKFREFLAAFKPDLVNLSQSESVEAIEDDLLSVGVEAPQAATDAKRIHAAIAEEWQTALREFPKTYFIVSAGNGGLDGVGHVLAEKTGDAVPASLSAPNLIVTGSFHEQDQQLCPSRFSNHGARVRLWAAGEHVESASGCAIQPKVKLSGTSQATARATNYFAKQWTQGVDPAKALGALPRMKCKEIDLVVLK